MTGCRLRDAAKMVIRDNPELTEKLEQQIMTVLRESDAAPKDKAAEASKATSKKEESAAAEADEKDDDLFDGTLTDDFSIEEDL